MCVYNRDNPVSRDVVSQPQSCERGGAVPVTHRHGQGRDALSSTLPLPINA